MSKHLKDNKAGSKTNIKQLQKSMQEFREGIKEAPLPDRPRIKYLTASTLETLAIKVEDAFDNGFMLYDTVKQLIEYNYEGEDLGAYYIQTMMKKG